MKNQFETQVVYLPSENIYTNTLSSMATRGDAKAPHNQHQALLR